MKQAASPVRPLDRAWEAHINYCAYSAGQTLLRLRGEGHWYLADVLISNFMLRLKAEPRPEGWTPRYLQRVEADKKMGPHKLDCAEPIRLVEEKGTNPEPSSL